MLNFFKPLKAVDVIIIPKEDRLHLVWENGIVISFVPESGRVVSLFTAGCVTLNRYR